jgi:hypothetical protein
MFDNIDADIYLMVDGDETYPASSAPALIEEFQEGHVDMMVGVRMSTFKEKSFRRSGTSHSLATNGLIEMNSIY